MPHITMEFSANLAADLNVGECVDALHEATISTGLFDISAVRTRAVAREHFRVADGDPSNGFVHVTARIRIGRSEAQRQDLAEKLLASLDRTLKAAFAAHPLAVTVEIHEIDQLTLRRNTIREKTGQHAG